MPYGVDAALFGRLPSDDQAAIKAGWVAAGGNPDGSGSAGGVTSAGTFVPPPPPPPPPPIPPPANLDTDALVPAGVNVPAGYLGVTLIPAPPAPAPAPPIASAGQPDDGGGELETFSLEGELLHEPGQPDVKLPAGAWADFRDYLVKDQPFLGSHVRARGRGLKDVVASDLWSAST